MIKNTILINRPIVCSTKGVKLCRPKEEFMSLLDKKLLDHFFK